VLCAGLGADRAWQFAYRRAVSTATIVVAADEVQRRARLLGEGDELARPARAAGSSRPPHLKVSPGDASEGVRSLLVELEVGLLLNGGVRLIAWRTGRPEATVGLILFRTKPVVSMNTSSGRIDSCSSPGHGRQHVPRPRTSSFCPGNGAEGAWPSSRSTGPIWCTATRGRARGRTRKIQEEYQGGTEHSSLPASTAR
jgi:hypothetical protein